MTGLAAIIAFYAGLAAAALGPAILLALTIRFLKGWVRRLTVPVLVIALMTVPYVLMAPEIHSADGISIDYGSYVVLGIMMLTGLILISALIGVAVGAFLLHLHRENQSRAGRMFWMTKDSR